MGSFECDADYELLLRVMADLALHGACGERRAVAGVCGVLSVLYECGQPLLGRPFGSGHLTWTPAGEIMGIDEDTIREIVRRILSVTKPDKIILFGSAATGGMTRDSDIDLLIVEPDTSDRRNEYVRIIKALWDIRYPFDVLFITAEWFEQSKDVIGGIAYPANKYGKVIYDAA